jgi:hypothetical protein
MTDELPPAPASKRVGRPSKPGTMLMTVRLPGPVHDRYARAAARDGVDIRHVIAQVLLHSRRQRAGRPPKPKTEVVTIRIPSAIYSRFRKLGRLSNKSTRVIVQRILTEQEPQHTPPGAFRG